MARARAVKIDGKEIALAGNGGDGDTQVIAVEPGLYLVRQGSEQSLVHVDGAGNGKLMVEVRRPGRDPVIVTAELVDGRRAPPPTAARAAGEAPPAIVRSPIPGRVVKVMVKVSDQVTAGQTLVVLEAMKMENELRAPRAGTVHEVRCAEGTAVEAGQDLVTLR